MAQQFRVKPLLGDDIEGIVERSRNQFADRFKLARHRCCGLCEISFIKVRKQSGDIGVEWCLARTFNGLGVNRTADQQRQTQKSGSKSDNLCDGYTSGSEIHRIVQCHELKMRPNSVDMTALLQMKITVFRARGSGKKIICAVSHGGRLISKS
ncbi:MAG: hypothetical protein AAF666_14460 [Pseudomonadota bacterium]